MKKRKIKGLAEEWLEFHQAKVKHSTYKMYCTYIKRIKLEIGDKYISDITPLIAQKLLNSLYSQGYAKGTINKYKLTLQQIADYAIYNGFLKRNFCENTYVPINAPTKKVRSLTDEEIDIVLNSYDKRFGLFAYILLVFGLRRSEALALTWDDFDFENNILHVNKMIEYYHSKPIICNRLKNSDEERLVPILPGITDVLKRYYQPGKIVFPFNNEHMTYAREEHEWEHYKRQANLDINKHQCRHAYATLLYRAGVDLKTAMVLLGHKDMKMLLKVYTHSDTEVLTQAVSINLENFLEKKYNF